MKLSDSWYRSIIVAIAATVMLFMAMPNALAEGGESPDCPADINGDGVVDVLDLLEVLSSWGQTGVPADINGDGWVDVLDLLEVLSTWGPCTIEGLITIDLAGNSLGEYPYVEFVTAYNQGSTLEVAIDPGDLNGLFPAACDVYITTAKTESQWVGNPTLSDVRGAPQTVDFGGGTIQDNTFTLVDSDTLSGEAGLGLGVGYDIVCDFNQNGQLDSGDYIDGFGDKAGFYVVHDLTEDGPLAVTEIDYTVGAVFGIPSHKTYQNTYYPTDIASMGELPLIQISHGNGHYYQWYDHLGYYFASYGYIVMSHMNYTEPGVETAADTTLGHMDAFLDQLDTIGGGVLVGHLDYHNTVWIGHSRGGEGIAIAYDRIYDEVHTPVHYELPDIILLSSMLPIDFTGPDKANPHNVNYHLWTASGDADVHGGPGSDGAHTYPLFERATGFKQSTTVQGTGHGDFHASSGSVFTGPCHITPKDRVHDIMKGYFLPLIKFYMDDNIPAKDFLWRQWESFKPIGAPEGPICTVTGGDTVVVNNEFRQGVDAGAFVIDDYQTGSELDLSSSGGTVTYTVTEVYEGLLRDIDFSTFVWTPSDPMNGMTRARTNDWENGVVFDWTAPSYYEYEIVEAGQDFSQFDYFSLRACQQTRHPYTVAELGDVTFTVTLRDGGGNTSSINIGAYGTGDIHGGGVEEPYQRSGGWANEFETILMNLKDFTHNESGIDLTNIEAVRLEFGEGYGSPQGRIGLDSVEIAVDAGAPVISKFSIILPEGTPDPIAPGVDTVISVEIKALGESYIVGSGALHYRYDGGDYLTQQLTALGDDLYEGTLPPVGCDDTPEFYFSAEGDASGVHYLPEDAPYTVYTADVGEIVTAVYHDFETDPGWTVSGDASDGHWERGVPVGSGAAPPPTDYDGSGQCWLTDNAAGNSDVDNGTTTLTSTFYDVSALSDPVLSYARWYYSSPEGDVFLVEIWDASIGEWKELETVGPSGDQVHGGWYVPSFRLLDYISTIDQVRVRFHASDLPPSSTVEAGIDAFHIWEFVCEE